MLGLILEDKITARAEPNEIPCLPISWIAGLQKRFELRNDRARLTAIDPNGNRSAMHHPCQRQKHQ